MCTHIQWQLGLRRGSTKRESRDRGKPKRRAYVYDNLQDLAYAKEASLLTGSECHAMTRGIGRCQTLIGGTGDMSVEATMVWQCDGIYRSRLLWVHKAHVWRVVNARP